MTAHRATRNEAGSYEYRGRTIYRLPGTNYNPWKIALSRSLTYPTLAAAKRDIDRREAAKAAAPTTPPEA